jgi:hypothetical protein
VADLALRPRASVPALALAVLLVLMSLAGADAASPSPNATVKTPDITGHWTSASYGDIDFVQKGVNVTGTSPTGLNITGVLTGSHLVFSFWRGKSYDAATTENRGHGTIDIAANGKTASVTWASEDQKGNYKGTFTLTKVGGGGGGPSFEPTASQAPATPDTFQNLQDSFVDMADNLLAGGDSDEDIAFGGVTFIIVWAANHPEALPSAEPTDASAGGSFELPLASLPALAPFPSGEPPVDTYDISPDDFSTGGE